MIYDYSYSHEWDREYCYPDSSVLINKLNIHDADALRVAEREITSLRLAAAKDQPVKGKFDLKHLQAIHAYVFGDMYAWAGKLRHVDFSLVSAEEMIVASADSFACDYNSINKMFDRITTPISTAEQRQNVQFFFGK